MLTTILAGASLAVLVFIAWELGVLSNQLVRMTGAIRDVKDAVSDLPMTEIREGVERVAERVDPILDESRLDDEL